MSTEGGEPLHISDETVRALIDEQFPQFEGVELGRRYTLEDHLTVRIGDTHGATFPRVDEDDEYFARAADLIAPHARTWTFPSSHPIATGRPGHGYPHPWVIVDWTVASTASLVPLRDDAFAALGSALRQVHSPSPKAAPLNPRTSIDAAELTARFERRLSHVLGVEPPEHMVFDADLARAMFAMGKVGDVDVAPTWTHGRLEPRSILSDRGQFAGILLWHNFGAGDPAADLGCALNVIPLDMRDGFWRAYRAISPHTAARATSYQVLVALRYIEIGDPFLVRMAWERLIELDVVRPG